MPSYRYRERTAVEYSESCGRAELIQFEKCREMTDCVFPKEEIFSSQWSSCIKQTENTGVQNLTLTSMTSDTEVRVSRACPIRPACVVSNWSKWSSCRENAELEFVQTRYRYPVNWTSQDITDCGAITEQKSCNESETYNWQMSPWTDCIINDKNEVRSCGEGAQTRVVYCGINNKVTVNIDYRSKNKFIKKVLKEDSLCESFMKPESTRSCQIKCASTCTFSQWSEWSQCEPDKCEGRYKFCRIS